MAILKATNRNKLKSSVFGLPKERKYPMNDREHAILAKGRAKEMVKAGKLSASSAARIRAKANKMLAR